jgi:ubiquinone/menaquinone biosynthesis C-methylase UbiE
VLDVGCGKGFLLYELTQSVPGIEAFGLDISEYGVADAKPEMKPRIAVGNARALPFPSGTFDVVISLGTLHNLPVEQTIEAFAEIERVGRSPRKYVMVESFRDERERANLMYWQLTCESLLSPSSWAWAIERAGYRGDHGFIFFE